MENEIEQHRTRFELYANKCIPGNAKRDDHGGYVNADWDAAWDVWLAAKEDMSEGAGGQS